MKRIDNILLLILILTMALIASASTLKTASAQGHAGPYYTVESPSNSSTIVMGPAPAVGQTFNVTIKLYNVTTSDVPAGTGGAEVHLTWNNTLIEPVSFVNKIGLPGGVLNPPVIYGIPAGFYDNAGNAITTAPYTNATRFEVAAAPTYKAALWWGDGAEVAEITFKVDLQPQPFGTCPLTLFHSKLDDINATLVPCDQVNATYTILTTPINETLTFGRVTFPLSIDTDSQITAQDNMGFQNYTDGTASLTFNVTSFDGFCNVTVPNDFMWSNPLDNWTITVDGLAPQSKSITYDSANAYLWFNWSTAGNHVIMLKSTNVTNVVPEFAATSFMLFLMATTLIVTTAATVLKRRKLHR
jgi:hypothetical protein